MSLYKFTHIPLLKNDGQLKQKSDKQPKKEKQSPNLLKNKNHVPKNKSCLVKQKKNKKKRATSRKGKEKKEKEKGNELPMCKCTWAFSSIKQPIFSLQFSPHFREKTFWWARRENTLGPPFIFLSLHPTKHTPKKFFFPFSLQNFLSTLFLLQTNTSLRLKNRK